MNKLLSEKIPVYSGNWFAKNKQHVNKAVLSEIEYRLGKITADNFGKAVELVDELLGEKT